MLRGERTVWVRVAHGLESLSGLGARVWNEPAAVRNALRELLSVLPLTHVQLDLAALRRRSDPAAGWKAVLGRGDGWAELLRETTQATSDAVRGRAEWGIGLPGPAEAAASLGDASERGVLKAGLQLASFLQGLREADLAFVAVDLSGASVPDKVVAPVFRNAEMYGWRRAAVVGGIAEGAGAAEIRLVGDAPFGELCEAWRRGELVGGGLGAAFWSGAAPPAPVPPRALLFGEMPAGIEPAAIVAAGRSLHQWLS
ncbi:MAG: hypothetical protein HYY35_00285 [Deltaproteobacteria bacterium]|nr:hypothetical protein [Deltaproteobacteria bacterium]